MNNNIFLELNFKNLNIHCINTINNKLLFFLKKYLNTHKIKNSFKIDNFTTPERIIIDIKFDDITIYLYKGAKITQKEEHLDFFLQKNNLNNINQLEIIDSYYYYKKNISNIEIIENFKKNITKILKNTFLDIILKKNPLLHLINIVCFINTEIYTFNFNNIQSNNNLKINNKEYKISSIDEFYNKFKEEKIFFDINLRKDFLEKQLEQYTSKYKQDFLNNLLSIREKPLFIMGKLNFNCNLLFLQILEKFCKNHYLFFIKNDCLNFISLDDNGNENIISENIDIIEYHKEKISKNINKIYNLIRKFENFQENKENKYIFNETKIARLGKLTKFISLWIPQCNLEDCDKLLSNPIFKVINLIEDNNELIVLFKKYILNKNKESENFISLFVDCLRPFEKNKQIPTIPLAVAIVLSNKIDNIIYISVLKHLNIPFNKANEKKYYNDLIRIIIENKINLSLKMFFNYAMKNFINETIDKKQNIKFIKKYNINKDIIVQEILENCYIKLYFYLTKDDSINNILLNILISEKIKNISRNKTKCFLFKDSKKILEIFKYLSNTENIICQTYKRLNNLLLKYQKHNFLQTKPIMLNFNKIFKSKEEQELYNMFFIIRKEIKYSVLVNEDYSTAMDSLDKLSKYINSYLNIIFIEKSSNIFEKKQRIKLLFAIKYLFDSIENFENLTTKNGNISYDSRN